MLTVTTAAIDLTLLTQAERRAAVGVADASKDAELATLEARVAALIVAACNVARGGVTPSTLRLETLTETFRLKSSQGYLQLSRRPIVSITSVTEDDDALVAADYEIDGYQLRRIDTDEPSNWPTAKTVVVYTAGWSTVPETLKSAAVKFMQAEWQQGDRDPMLKSKSIEGVSSYEWWVDPTKDSVVPADVMDILQRGGYMNTWIG